MYVSSLESIRGAGYDVSTDSLKAIRDYLELNFGYTVQATGTLTTSSATVPADTGRTEATGYFNGSLLLITSGALAKQSRRITTFTATTGVFTIDEFNPFTSAPGLVTYAIIAKPQVDTDVQERLVANNLDHLAKIATASADMTTEVTDASIISRILSKTSDTSTYNPTTDSLEAIRDHATTIKTDTGSLETKVGTNADVAGTTTVFARVRQIVDTYLADATIGLSALKTLIDAAQAEIDDATYGLAAIKTTLGDSVGADLSADIAAIQASIDAGFALTGDAVVEGVLDGKFFYKDNYQTKLEGTMPDRAGDTVALSSSVDGTTLKLLASDGYRDGVNDNVTITDAAFLAENIKDGVTIFGVLGTYTGP